LTPLVIPKSCERIRSSLELCDVSQNLQSFIDVSATGAEVPDIPAYLSSKNVDGAEVNSPTIPRAQAPEQRTRTVCGPHQPIPSNDNSTPSSRRQSVYSADCRSDTDGASGAPIEMALQIGGNVFKLDTQTTTLLNQVDDSAPPDEPVVSYSDDRSSVTKGPVLHQSVGENSLGISLDASGTVKENRFPHWQSQVPLQPHPTPVYPSAGSVHPHGHSQQHGSMNVAHGGAPAIHSHSQTLPIHNESSGTGFHGASSVSHMRTPSGSYAASPGTNQFHDQYRGVAGPPTTQHMHAAPQTAHDGRPILFYGI